MNGKPQLRNVCPSSIWSQGAATFLAMLTLAISSGASAEPSRLFAAPSSLVSTMPDRYNVHLQWKNHATAEGGNLVEFQMFPEGTSLPADERDQFLILAFLPSTETTFRHENLGSETVFLYRIRPYFGPCTTPTEITTGPAAAAENEPEAAEGPLEEPGKTSKGGDALPSLRAADTFAAAAPTQLTVERSGATQVVLRWQDRAADGDGYLVEVSRFPDRDFQICALLPPRTTSFRKIGLPPDTKLYFRVRAFFHGPPSNVVTATTGPQVHAAAAPKPD